jgi:multidrug transporter EmrE-like cation transporter
MSFTEIIVLVFAIVFNAAANILLKLGMKDAGSLGKLGIVRMFTIAVTNAWVWLGLASFGIAFILYSIVLSRMKLSVAYPIMTSCGFVIVVVAAMLLFSERPSLPMIGGIALIAAGIWVISMSQ